MRITESQRRKSIEDSDFFSEELSTEIVLVVYTAANQNISQEHNQKRYPSTLSLFYDPLGLASPFILRRRKIL